jgi:uncharacterized membrane protein
MLEENIISATAPMTGLDRDDTKSLPVATVAPLTAALTNFIPARRTKVRSLLKAISYRVFGSFVTVAISYFLTKKISLSLSIGAFELTGKIVLYYLHERIWDKIS